MERAEQGHSLLNCVRARPLVTAATAFAAGILAAGSVYWLAALFLAAAALSALWLRRGAWQGQTALLFALLTLAGGLRTIAARIPDPRQVSRLAPALMTVRGIVVSDVPIPNNRSGRVMPAKLNMSVQAVQVGASSRWLPASGIIQASLGMETGGAAGHLPSWGDTLTARGQLHAASGLRNPGGVNWRKVLAGSETIAVMNARHSFEWHIDEPAKSTAPLFFAYKMRRWLERHIGKLYPGPAAALIETLLLGQRGDLSASVRDDFQRAGAAHLLAIAGLQIGLLAFFLPRLLQRMLLPYRTACFLSALAVGFYSLLGGSRPSLERAALVGMIALAAPVLEREFDWSSSLALAALVLLMYNPLTLYTSGFLLSFLVVCTLALWMPALWTAMQDWLWKLIPGKNAVHYFFRKACSALLGTLMAGMLAQTAAAPIVALFYHQLSALGFLNALLLLPAILVLLLLAPCSLLLPALVPLVNGVSRYELALVHWLSRPYWACLSVRSPSLWFIAAYYACLTGGALWIWPHQARLYEEQAGGEE